MDRHILFYLVGRLILVNGLSLIIPLTAGLLWGERGLLYFGPPDGSRGLIGVLPLSRPPS